MTLDTFAPGFAKDQYAGTYRMSLECVRMIGSLFHAPPSHGGFLTPGGTESNLYGVRLARNLGKKSRPELVMPESAHYSFHLGGELFGVQVQVAEVNSDMSPKMKQVKELINENTVMLVCSAPEGSLGIIDPVVEFGELAEKHGLYLHVDSCVGGFILPFMRELGYEIPEFDFRVPQLSSISADPHKLGMQQKPTSSFTFRDREYLNSIPVESVLVPYLSGSSRIGASAASLWALLRHLGMDGYKRYIGNAMKLTELIAEEVNKMDGLKLIAEPVISIVGISSERYDVRKIEKKLASKGWVTPVGAIPHAGTRYIRIYVHPLKTRDTIEAYLDDLRKAVKSER